MSLHELAMFILKERKYTAKYNDDLCVVCWDGGTCCSVMDAQGRFTKNVRQYQVFLVVIGIVKSAKTCSKEKVLLQTMSMLWQQKGLKELVPLNRLPDIALKAPCEKEYHVGCLRDHKMAFLKEFPEGIWICSSGISLGCNKGEVVSMFQECFDAIIDPVRDYLNVLNLATTAFFFFTVVCRIKRAKELENVNTRHPQLLYESKLYKILQEKSSSFRDRRYEYKGLNKVWKGKLPEAKANGNPMKIQEAQIWIIFIGLFMVRLLWSIHFYVRFHLV